MISNLLQVRGHNDICTMTYNTANVLTVSSSVQFQGNASVIGDIVLASLGASTVPYIGPLGHLASSAVTPVQLGHLAGVTSSVQTQLNSKQPTLTPATNLSINGLSLEGSLAVAGVASAAASAYAYFVRDGDGGVRTGDTTGPLNVSIAATNGAVQAAQFVAVSDARIKTGVCDVDIDAVSDALSRIPVKSWAYKDEIAKGSARRLGLIAQDVAAVPELAEYAVTRHADFLPNVYATARLTAPNTYTLDGHGMRPGDTVKYFTREKSCIVTVGQTTSDTFEIECDDPDIFVLGTHATDIMSIDYDALVAALLASHRQLQRRVERLEAIINVLGDAR